MKYYNKFNNGFTLIELLVAIGVISILSAIVLFSVTQYINRGKDGNVQGNLAILIPAGEVYYNIGNTYNGFCDPNQNNVIKNAISQIPAGTTLYCFEDSVHNYQAWVACAKEFTNINTAYCVDSRGMKEETSYSNCTNLSSSQTKQCP